MNKILPVIVCYILLSSFQTTNKEINVVVILENFSKRETIQGEFYIEETNQKFGVNSLDEFKFILPKKGKYKFKFIATGLVVNITSPKKITEKNNTITIKLYDLPAPELNILSNKEINEKVNQGRVNFIINGISSTIPSEYNIFKEKYGIGFVMENCVIDPLTYKKTREHNNIILDYLNSKYGQAWYKELPAKPFGIK